MNTAENPEKLSVLSDIVDPEHRHACDLSHRGRRERAGQPVFGI